MILFCIILYIRYSALNLNAFDPITVIKYLVLTLFVHSLELNECITYKKNAYLDHAHYFFQPFREVPRWLRRRTLRWLRRLHWQQGRLRLVHRSSRWKVLSIVNADEHSSSFDAAAVQSTISRYYPQVERVTIDELQKRWRMMMLMRGKHI